MLYYIGYTLYVILSYIITGAALFAMFVGIHCIFGGRREKWLF